MEKITNRIQSIDIMRGIIMAIMALDHTRDYFHLTAMADEPTNLETTTPLLFLTRWITHFCAPAFVFLSGVSIYLQGLRKPKRELAWFLLTRGLWLIVAEVTLTGFGWSFDPSFDSFFLQVIWAIGCSMVILSGLIFFRYGVLAVLGVALTLFHNMMDSLTITDPALDAAANFFLVTDFEPYSIGGIRILVAYAVLPWTGIMLLGYAAGKWYSSSFTSERRSTLLIATGSMLIVLFLGLRLVNSYGDPRPWELQRNGIYTALSFLNTTKYPPSLMYTCMTLGPVLIMLALTEGVRNRFTAIMNIFGRVPFFYYIIHIYIIHLLCAGLYFIQGYTLADLGRVPMSFAVFRPKEHFGFGLGGTYLVWLLVLVLCYFPSRWYNSYKSTHKKWWLSYL